MNTATQTAPTAAPADRFRCESDVPDPPRDAAGRKQYWEDTVAEAVAELRRRLASTRDEKSFQALQMIVDLEKTRLRHKEPVAGTQVETRWSSGLGSMEDSTSIGGKYEGPKKSEPEASATGEHLIPPVLASRDREGVASRECEAPVLASRDREGVASWEGEASLTQAEMPLPCGRGSQEPMPLPCGRGSPDNDTPLNTPSPERGGGRGVGSSASPPKPARPIPLHVRDKPQDGIRGHFHDHDDDWMLERGRGRRKRDTGAEADAVEAAVPLDLPTPGPLPKVRNFDLFSPRPECQAGGSQ